MPIYQVIGTFNALKSPIILMSHRNEVDVVKLTDVAYADAPLKLRFLVFDLRTYDSKNAFDLGDLLTVMGQNTPCRF